MFNSERVKFTDGSLRRFWARVKREGECWVWNGPVGVRGYGAASLSGVQGAHRIAWVWKHGAVPAGCLRNDCGNSLCVNPAHWRDEGPKRIVEKVGDVRQAEMERLAREGLGIGEIAARVGCCRGTVWRRLRGFVIGPPEREDEDEAR